MGFIYVFFGLFAIMFVAVLAFVIVIFVTKGRDVKNKIKGDYLSPKPEEEPKKEKKPKKAETKKKEPYKELNKGGDKKREVSPVHANCDHAKQPSPYIDVNDTYSMVWDEFKSFALKLLEAEYPSAKISPYKYRGSPDIQLQAGGKDVDVRLIFVRENAVVDKKDMDAALKDIDINDDIADWIISNGRFSVMQRSAANAKKVILYDADDMFAMMRRRNISAKKA